MGCRTFIVDDNRRARQAVRAILGGDSFFEVVGEAESAREALERIPGLHPDLVLMDIRMPGTDGIALTRMLKDRLPEIKIVILTVSHDPADLLRAVRVGAQGYLVKSLDPSDWISYLRAVADGASPISGEVAARLVTTLASPAQGSAAEVAKRLTPREREILGLIARGRSNREIAEALTISENTVKNHLKNIMAKLDVKNRAQLAALAVRGAAPPEA
ncbi:DNA-binding response regulator [Kyrpidia spormannii]|uniref:DNA-binding response regulator n=1 Tax=Kyrpidia spormannii TaxID=2055160 RepID=A0A2K8N409_9BACL|nr:MULTISPECIES: response regulator transcription factor [Kyrpidia]ATY84178.1 DNA-binding response regulator [Kyrpidia spormannii]MCL6576992.1 response regulator transcription factor [Kyrpidia sp.]